MKTTKLGTLETARIEARTVFDKDVIYRRWNAGHGGVYAPVTDTNQPNLYLDVPEREITTPLGIKLTKINPAYMTRQIHELALKSYGIRGHITSLNPIRSANAPDPWETEALKSFQKGLQEVSSVEEIEGAEYMRLMKPLVTEDGCLKCHAIQGYKIGDIRGGISVSIPMAPHKAIAQSKALTLYVIYGLLWLIGFIGMGISMSRLSQQIHKREANEAALKESEERFRTLFEKAPLAYQSLDEKGTLIAVNKTWLSIMEFSKKDVIGQNFSQFLHPDWKDHFKENFPRFKAVGEILGTEFIMQKKDGTEVLVSFHGKIGKNAMGDFKQTHCVFSDITQQRKAAEEKKRLEGQLLQSQKMESIGTLAGGIAHEFNNILSIIIGNNELIMDELPKGGSARESSDEIRMAGFRARDVVKQLLLFSRQDDTKATPMDIRSVVKESMKLIRSSIPANIDIHQNLTEAVDPVYGNPTQINQILINLCSNAADAMMHTGGSIRIDLCKQGLDETCKHIYPPVIHGQYVKLKVSDTGCGMDKKTLDRIFEPYFTTKDIGKGSGIGMAVVHGIVERHGGSISVESTPEKGTIFTIIFPAYQGRIEKETEEDIILPTGSERILIVDDEPILIKLGKQRLESLGYSVQGIIDPLEALEMFRADPDAFDMIITDMAMPQMTGDQLVLEILKIRPKLPTMLCTGYSEKISAEKAYSIGFSSFIMKPVDRAEFAVSVRKVLDETKDSIQKKI